MARSTKQTFDTQPSTEQSALKRAEKREDTRSWMSLLFIIGYLSVIVILILLITFANLKPDTAKDYLLAIGSPLGFIIGYYFKSSQQD